MHTSQRGYLDSKDITRLNKISHLKNRTNTLFKKELRIKTVKVTHCTVTLLNRLAMSYEVNHSSTIKPTVLEYYDTFPYCKDMNKSKRGSLQADLFKRYKSKELKLPLAGMGF